MINCVYISIRFHIIEYQLPGKGNDYEQNIELTQLFVIYEF